MFKNLGLEVIRMKKLFELLKQTNKLIFTSSSLCRSEMNWNYTGEGSTIVSVDNNKIHFLDRITLDNRMSYEDKKLWVFDGEKVANTCFFTFLPYFCLVKTCRTTVIFFYRFETVMQ